MVTPTDIPTLCSIEIQPEELFEHLFEHLFSLNASKVAGIDAIIYI